MTTPPSTQDPRERLLETASRLFYAHGVSRVGINEVIREAGIARMTLYYHFRSKEVLVKSVLQLRVQNWERWFVGAVESRSRNPRERLLGVFDLLDAHFAEPEFRGCSALNFSSDASESDPELAEIARAHKMFVLAYLEKLAKEVPCRQPGDLARELLLLQNGATVLAQLGGAAYRPGDARHAAAKLIDRHKVSPRKRRKRKEGDG